MSDVYSTRLGQLRGVLAAQGFDGFIVPHADEYLSEYLSPSAERLAWLTGFTGSAGICVVFQDCACVMTDGRYTTQIRQQVNSSLYEILDSVQISTSEWIAKAAHKGMVIGFDPRLHTTKNIEALSEKCAESGVTFSPVSQNPLDALWSDRPVEAPSPAELFPDQVAGLSARQKVARIAEGIKSERLSAVVITAPDSIAWLLNVRGDDVPFNPVVLSHVIVYDDARVDWFVHPKKITDEVAQALGGLVKLCDPSDFLPALAALAGSVQVDFQRSNYEIFLALKNAGLHVVDGKDPCIVPKSLKSVAEQVSLRQAHIRDGVALVRLMYWLYLQDFRKTHITERMIEDKLQEFRRGDPTYRGPSFNTICGWGAHGAIIHYKSTPESDVVIHGDGFLLLDSGGQYEYGTTDITRTFAIGLVSGTMKEHYTRVLKGHIAIACARFDDTTVGSDLDKLARAPLVTFGLDYPHSTGHGVGCYLCVHEEASTISSRGQGTYKAGMLLSNEPGFYLDGQYGIRLENLMLCQEADDGQMFFDTVTVVPFDLAAVAWDLLTDAEYDWLAAYHRHVYDTLSPFLNEIEPEWLKTFLLPPLREEQILA